MGEDSKAGISMRITILGKRWMLKFVTRMNNSIRGECEPPHSQKKEIRIRSSLKGEERLEVTIHEILHAADWHKDEEWVERVAADLARVLWKLGYKRDVDE